MTAYRTCLGCARQNDACAVLDRVRAQIKGLGVTTIRWRCTERVQRFKRGDPVWAFTVDGSNEYRGRYGEEEPFRDHFPAVIVDPDLRRSKLLVYIEDGALGRDDTANPFKSKDGRGFCKIPLSRITPREGDAVELCRSCDWPISKGHQQGYMCSIGAPP